MDIQTEHNLTHAPKRLTRDEEEYCQADGEYLYESLTNDYLARKLAEASYGDVYNAWRLALDITPGVNEALYILAQKVEQILYLMRRREADYEVFA